MNVPLPERDILKIFPLAEEFGHSGFTYCLKNREMERPSLLLISPVLLSEFFELPARGKRGLLPAMEQTIF